MRPMCWSGRTVWPTSMRKSVSTPSPARARPAPRRWRRPASGRSAGRASRCPCWFSASAAHLFLGGDGALFLVQRALLLRELVGRFFQRHRRDETLAGQPLVARMLLARPGSARTRGRTGGAGGRCARLPAPRAGWRALKICCEYSVWRASSSRLRCGFDSRNSKSPFFTAWPSFANTSSTRPDSTESRMTEFSGSALARTTMSSRNTPCSTRPGAGRGWPPAGRAARTASRPRPGSAVTAAAAPMRAISRPRRLGTTLSMAAPVTAGGGM
jgi:hypothetical protein